MSDDFTLGIFYENWHAFMDTVKMALAPLTADQLQLRAAPHERSVGELAQHIISARVDWFQDFMGEGGAEVTPYIEWGAATAPARTAAELVAGLDATWQFMAECLARWTPADMQHTFPLTWRDQHYDLSRSWVVWHILEHDLIHAGEISLTLGLHGLPAPRP